MQEKINQPIVTIFADDNKKYLSTDLINEIEENKDFVSNQIELIKYESAWSSILQAFL